MAYAGKPFRRAGLALAAGLCLTACGSLTANRIGPPFRDPTMSMQAAQDAVAVGKATQAEVLAVLGPATQIAFDSGYAVWIYRARPAKPDAHRAELVILFAPSGIAKKSRLRPSPP